MKKNSQTLTNLNRIELSIIGVIALTFTLYLSYIDEGNYDFRWVNEPVDWLFVGIYFGFITSILYGVYFGVKVLFQSR